MLPSCFLNSNENYVLLLTHNFKTGTKQQQRPSEQTQGRLHT